MNIIKNHRLSFMLIMMSAQSFLCHANKIEDSFAILADDMYNKAHLFVDPTYVVAKPNPRIRETDFIDSLKKESTGSFDELFATIVKPILSLREYVKKCDDNRRKKEITYQDFSSEALSHFLFQAEQAIYHIYYPYSNSKEKTDFIDDSTEKLDPMKEVMQTLNTMQSPLFAYCLSFIYLKMKSIGIDTSYTFFFDDSETDPSELLNRQFNNMKLI